MQSPPDPETQPPSKALPDRVRFARFELQPLESRLLVDGKPVALGRRAFDLLQVLVERAGSLVTRHELIDRVWPNLVVEENNLNVQVNALRRVLGADVVVTVPGRGYRLAARVESVVTPPPLPPASPAVPRTHLPVGMPALFGRDDELSALGVLLDAHRLVTVAGAGGVGKSRLAQVLLLQRQASQAGGVCWIDLQAAVDAAALPGVVGTALGLQRAPGEPLASLVQAAAGLEALVALDGAEGHLEAVAGLVQALLDGVAGLRLLVTSQAPLRLAAERVLRLGPLSVPAAQVAPAHARRQGAIALFIDRACAADSRFTVSDAQMPAVRELCLRLDGLPLALELAAARAPVMGVTALLGSLNDRLQLLTANRNRLAPPRQQTLRDALAWSHALLGPLEQALFRNLAVVAGSAPLSLVQGLMAGTASADDHDRWALLDALDQLVQRSLVDAVSDESWSAPRYRLLESPRLLALEQLVSAGEEAQARRRHACAVLAEFERAEQALLSGTQGVDDWRREGEGLLADAQLSLAWARAAGEPVLALALAQSLLARVPDPRHVETLPAVQACEALLDAALDLDPALACRAWLAVSLLGFHGPQRQQAATRRALAWARQLGEADAHRFVRYSVLCEAARALAALRQMAEAQALMDEAHRLEDPHWPPVRRRVGPRAEAFLAMAQGRADLALQRLRQVLALSLAAGDRSLATRLNMADMELLAGDARAAVATGTSLVAELAQLRTIGLLALARMNLAGAHLALEQTTEARDALQAAWHASRRFERDWPHRTACIGLMALLAALEGRHEAAARLQGAADARHLVEASAFDGNQALARERCCALLAGAIGGDCFERLQGQGAELDDTALATLAFDNVRPSADPR